MSRPIKMIFLKLDLNELFQIETSLFNLFLRGSILYLGILFLVRILPRRTGGEMAMTDLIFILLITESASHSLGDYSSLTEGFILIATLVTWNFSINVLSYYFPFIEKLVSSPPIQIVKNGKMLRKNMRREYLTEDELIEHLRKEGIEDVRQIKKACIETDGSISVIKMNKKE